MKKILAVSLFALIQTVWAITPPAGWFTDFDAAKETAVKANKPVLVLFSGTDWCPPCKRLRTSLLDTPEFQQMIKEKCVALYVHVPRGNDEAFVRMMSHFHFVELQGVPTIIVTDPSITKVLVEINDRTLGGFAAGIETAQKAL